MTDSVEYAVAILNRTEMRVRVPRELAIESGIGSLVYDKVIERLTEDEQPGMDSVDVQWEKETSVVQVIASSEPGLGIHPEHRNEDFDRKMLMEVSPVEGAQVVYTVT